MNFPFTSYDPNAPTQRFKPERLISSVPTPKDKNDFGFGENQFYVLPSCSNYHEYEAVGWQDYPLGAFYNRIRVKTYSDKFDQSLRVEPNNPLSAAYWKLYNTLCPGGKIAGTIMETIRKKGFDAGISHRCVLNIVRNTELGISKLLWFDAGCEKPGVDVTQLTKKSTLTMIVDGLGKVFAAADVPGVKVECAALMSMMIEFNGTIAQYKYCLPVNDGGSVTLSNLSSAIKDFDVSQLDEAKDWASTMDPLPELSQIPALVECGQACEVLGLPTNQAPGNPAMSAPSNFQQPPPQMSPAFAAAASAAPVAPPPQAAQQQVAQPPVQPPVQAPPQTAQQQAAQPPVQPPVQAPPAGVPSAADASASFAAQLEAKKLQEAQAQQPPAEGPAPAQF